MLNNFNKRLEKHCFLEYFYGKIKNSDVVLFESQRKPMLEQHGVMANMDDYCNAVAEFVRTHINLNVSGEYTRMMHREDFPFETFFDEIDFEINIKVINKNESYEHEAFNRSGYYKSGMSGYNGEKYTVEAGVTIIGDVSYIMRMLNVSVSHELTHAYDDYGRKSRAKGEPILNANYKRNVYNTSILDDNNMYEDNIHDLIYYTNNAEINSFIAQAKAEMTKYIVGTSSSQDAYNAIKNTTIYKIMMHLDEDCDVLRQIVQSSYQGHKEMLQAWMDAYNKVAKKTNLVKDVFGYKDNTINTPQGFYRFYRTRIKRLKKRIMTVLPKMAYDIYCEVGDPGTDYNRNL